MWPDLEKLMREHNVPQFTVDAHRNVGAFDLVGFSFSTELGYTNMLTALDLAGIAVVVQDAMRRPRALAHYITAARGGEGAIREVCEMILDARQGGC